MNNQFPHIIETETASPKNRFPIVLQLGLLGVIMIGLFSAKLFQPHPEPMLPDPAEQVFTTDENEYELTPRKIENVSVRAEAAYVWDVRAQRALFTKNADTELPLASITKLMTALLAYELISEDEKTAIPLSAIMQEGSSGLAVGEEMGVKELLELALVSSSNDAAYTLAASVGTLLGDQNPTAQFIRSMNIRATELGLESLHYESTTGLDISETKPGAVGSARDISFLMEYIISNYPELLAPTQQASAKVYNTAGAYHEANNTNEAALIIPNMIGSKTGYTDLAGGNLTIAFDAGLNRPIIITVLGSTREERFTDILALVAATQEVLSVQ